jgi:LuxR family transcriptional regulator, quorum-sensing system regulator BjaR1
MEAARLGFGREAFVFIDDVNRLTRSVDVVEAMQKAVRGVGYEYFSFFGFPNPNQSFAETMLAIHLPQRWYELYLAENYAQVDHILRFAKQTSRPFDWKSAPYDPQREPRTAEYAQRVNDFGLAEGYCVPIPGPRGSDGGVWMGGGKADPSPGVKPFLHLMALYAFERLRCILDWQPGEKPVLTSREREVLTWVAAGKSAWEIGEILRIAKRTVDQHVQNAFRKLGAANRTQAVALALRDRLIDP